MPAPPQEPARSGGDQPPPRHGAAASELPQPRRGRAPRAVLPAVLAALLAAAAPAQDDLRDRVVRRDGRELRGRVLVPAAADELLLLQGGKRVRVPVAEVARLDLVGERVRQFFDRRRRQRDQPRAQWFLCGWAQQQELPGLAALQALWLVLHDDDHADAHRFLGHRQGPKGWLWPRDDRWLSRAALEAELAERPLELRGERFRLRCRGDLRTCAAALLDLEALGVAWHEQFGAALQLRDGGPPALVDAHRDAASFPKWGYRPRPYYVPAPHGDVAHTWFAGPAPPRPELLFFTGTQALLYHTLVADGGADRSDPRDRVCAWLEVGLGLWCEQRMHGDPGFAAFGPPQRENLAALQALGRSVRLAQLTHLPAYGGFYLTDDAATQANWQAAGMFVAWLLADDDPTLRPAFLRFAREALGERRGDSSSRFDALFGRRIEAMENPWQRWLATQAGN